MRDRNRTFLLLMGAIVVLLVLGIALLVTVVLLYRASPGRNLPRSSMIDAAAAQPAPAPPSSPEAPAR